MSDDDDDLPLSTVLSRMQAAACEDLSCDCSIAFLFLTIGQIRNSDVWEAYFKSGGPTEYTIYVHAKVLPPAKAHARRVAPAPVGSVEPSGVAGSSLLVWLPPRTVTGDHVALLHGPHAALIDYHQHPISGDDR